MKTGSLPAIYLGGPTASGKSDLALSVGQTLGGEIISVDSMQVYRGLDIGTAKPSDAAQKLVRHHLIDVAELDEEFDAAKFVHLAGEAVETIRSAGHVPIFCGGTGFYFKAWQEGLGESPAADPTLRAELEQLSTEALLDYLKTADPEAWTTIDKENRRRLVRAVEVIRLTGRPFSKQKADWKSLETQSPTLLFGLNWPRAELNARIDLRVDQMFNRGLVEETERLLNRGLAQNRTAMQAIGYRQVVEQLQGKRSSAETIALVKQKTRQFAKRQMTWFGGQLSLSWFEISENRESEQLAFITRQIVSQWQKTAEASPVHGQQ